MNHRRKDLCSLLKGNLNRPIRFNLRAGSIFFVYFKNADIQKFSILNMSNLLFTVTQIFSKSFLDQADLFFLSRILFNANLILTLWQAVTEVNGDTVVIICRRYDRVGILYNQNLIELFVRRLKQQVAVLETVFQCNDKANSRINRGRTRIDGIVFRISSIVIRIDSRSFRVSSRVFLADNKTLGFTFCIYDGGVSRNTGNRRRCIELILICVVSIGSDLDLLLHSITQNKLREIRCRKFNRRYNILTRLVRVTRCHLDIKRFDLIIVDVIQLEIRTCNRLL